MSQYFTQRLDDYLKAYFKKSPPQEGNRVMLSYTPLLEHMLARRMEAKGVPASDYEHYDIKGMIEEMSKGGRFLEVGARYGGFLKFLKDHGAAVAGSTRLDYVEGARKAVGGQDVAGAPLIIGCSAEELVRNEYAKAAKRFNADRVYSLNVFDSRRWPDGAPVDKILKGMASAVAKDGEIYIAPSVDSHSVLKPEHLQRLSESVPVRIMERNVHKHGDPSWHTILLRPLKKPAGPHH